LSPACGPVLGDPQRLQQVVANLLGNAVKFTSPGGTISVRLEPVDGAAELSIHDTGKGIASKDLSLIFEPFHQGDSSSLRGQRGLGRGLAIVSHRVRQHGGTVRADSEGEGRGATFLVRIPFMQAESSDAAQAAPRPSVTLADRRLRGVSILVVEDDPDSREVV